MLQSDKLKLEIIKLLKVKGDITLGQIKRHTKVGHHYTIVNALEFLQKLGLVEVVQKGDKLGSKIVKLKNKI